MDFHGFLLQLTVVGAILAPVASQPKPGCSGSCGNLNIPFPFGTSPDCYLGDSFLITCNSTAIILPNCSHGKSGVIADVTASLTLSYFFISNTRNKFIAVDCDTVAVVEGSRGQNYATGCVSLCNGLDSVENGTCSGIGCREISVPKEARDFTVAAASLKNHSQELDFNPCAYAFVVEEDAFNFSTLDLKDLQSRETVPVVLDWAVGNQTCQ
ncbi:Wall-associated receptor kinase 2 [Camellia lanceoleosa]|uniref:Wall-associated receptor kinase 2 n=1 Tax=Camellia lanceoleosa TaxID=1840588 RepID=A0ACC0HNB3_9ERIC|nr:Wall-associated receptor kinase 2 [Camellia lanceoleosa]